VVVFGGRKRSEFLEKFVRSEKFQSNNRWLRRQNRGSRRNRSRGNRRVLR